MNKRATVCGTCGGDEVLHSTEWRNGREVEVSEACEDCCGDDDHDDREELSFTEKDSGRDQSDFNSMREEQHERMLRALGPAFFTEIA